MKKISQFTKDSLGFIASYPSIKKAVEKTGVTTISDCLNGKQRTAGAFVWEFYDKDRIKNRRKIFLRKPIVQSDTTGHVYNIFNSASEAEKKTGINKSNILRVLKGDRSGAGGFVWKYFENT